MLWSKFGGFLGWPRSGAVERLLYRQAARAGKTLVCRFGDASIREKFPPELPAEVNDAQSRRPIQPDGVLVRMEGHRRRPQRLDNRGELVRGDDYIRAPRPVGGHGEWGVRR